MHIGGRKLFIRTSRTRGFSLIELSIVIVILSLVAVMGLETVSVYMGRTAYSATQEKLKVIDQALRDYYRVTGRLPCPAVRSTTEVYSGSGTPNYGGEDCTNATRIFSGGVSTVFGAGGVGCSAGALSFSSGAAAGSVTVSGGAIATTTVSAAGSGYTTIPTVTRAGCGTAPTLVAGMSYVMQGAIPIVDLGLPVSAGLDGWGNKINYVVTQGLTDARTFPKTPSNVEIRSGKLEQPCNTTACQVLAAPAAAPADNGAAYALFSSGQDKRGAATRNGAVGVNCIATSTYASAIDSQNCATINTPTVAIGVSSIPGNVLYDSRFNSGTGAATNYFDDVMLWRTKGNL